MFEDEPLPFDGELGPGPVARATDPGTSWAAAASVLDVRETQRQVLKLFRLYGPMHDEQLVRRAARHGLPQSPSGLRTRRKELVTGGYLHDTGVKVRTQSGRSTIVWAEAPVTIAGFGESDY